jgi:hypothetical protein
MLYGGRSLYVGRSCMYDIVCDVEYTHTDNQTVTFIDVGRNSPKLDQGG